MRKGLTLIEVLVASAIFSFLSAALYSLLRTGIFVRNKVESQQAFYQDIHLRLEIIASQLRNIVFFADDNSGFRGYKDKEEGREVLQFYTLMFNYSEECRYPQISHIAYEFKDNQLSMKTLRLDSEEEIGSFVFMENLTAFNLTYFDAVGRQNGKEEWKDSSLQAILDEIPKGIKIDLEYNDEKGASHAMNKYIFIYRDHKQEDLL